MAEHLRFLRIALQEAENSPPKPTNFRVGCVIVSSSRPPKIVAIGYTLELPGNTHAEQCALAKLGYTESEIPSPEPLGPKVGAVLYTTLEPCGKRLSGNVPCVQRIIATRKGSPEGGIRKVIFGAKEPGTFVKDSESCKILTEAGVEWEYIPDLEEEILKVATEGHPKEGQKEPVTAAVNEGYKQEEVPKKESKETEEQERGTNVDDLSPKERRRQEEQPRNPKKRMMEVPTG